MFIGFLRSLAPATKVTKEQTPRARKKSPLFELSLVLVRLDHIASVIVNANLGVNNSFKPNPRRVRKPRVEA